jgi:hypothetical protein
VLINGKWVPAKSGETFDVLNPATGELLAKVASCGKEDVDAAVAAARKAFDDGPWSRMTPSARGKIIWKIGDLILENLDDLAQLESLDNGKPYAVARGADVPLAADLFHYMAGWATKTRAIILISVPYAPGAQFQASRAASRPVRRPDHSVELPLLMAAWKLGPALTTGCIVVLKVAERRRHGFGSRRSVRKGPGWRAECPDRLRDLWGTACATRGDKVVFTGSTEVGSDREGRARISRSHAGVGASPNILDDADRHRHSGRRQCHLLQPRTVLPRRVAPLRAGEGTTVVEGVSKGPQHQAGSRLIRRRRWTARSQTQLDRISLLRLWRKARSKVRRALGNQGYSFARHAGHDREHEGLSGRDSTGPRPCC